MKLSTFGKAVKAFAKKPDRLSVAIRGTAKKAVNTLKARDAANKGKYIRVGNQLHRK